MKKQKIFLAMVIMIMLGMGNRWIEHQVRLKAQHNERLYNLMIYCDGFTFLSAGGDWLGYQNYFKWQYARTLQDPATPILTRIMFWDSGIFYSAANPPSRYDYPPLYQQME